LNILFIIGYTSDFQICPQFIDNNDDQQLLCSSPVKIKHNLGLFIFVFKFFLIALAIFTLMQYTVVRVHVNFRTYIESGKSFVWT
jgi:hypothetical protein